jgi:undecaprenyl-diphosphatase
MAGTAVFVPLFKLLMNRERPIDIYTGADAFSFPSGHATITTVLYGLIAVLVAHDRSPLTKAGIFSVAVSLIGAVAFSRVYLGAHWASDVLGGLAFGTAMVSAFAFVFGSVHNEKVGRWALAALVSLTLALAGGFHAMRSFDGALAMYQPVSPTVTLAEPEWRAQGWKDLPAQRIELNGEEGEPLILQWAGDPARLAEALAPAGYVKAPQWSVATFTGFLTGRTPPEQLPALPRIQNGRGAELVLVRRDDERDPARAPKGTPGSEEDPRDGGRWVLRLWPTRFRVTTVSGEDLPIHVGSLIHERILRPLNELSAPRTDRDLPMAEENPLPRLKGVAIRMRADGSQVTLAVASDVEIADTPPAHPSPEGAQ